MYQPWMKFVNRFRFSSMLSSWKDFALIVVKWCSMQKYVLRSTISVGILEKRYNPHVKKKQHEVEWNFAHVKITCIFCHFRQSYREFFMAWRFFISYCQFFAQSVNIRYGAMHLSVCKMDVRLLACSFLHLIVVRDRIA